MSESKVRVLVIDDSQVARTIARIRLEKAGFEVHTLTSSLRMFMVIQSFKPDTVLLDVNLPYNSGDEAFKRLKTRFMLDCKVLLFSSAPVAELSARARKCGAFGFIRKDKELLGLPSDIEHYQRLAQQHTMRE